MKLAKSLMLVACLTAPAAATAEILTLKKWHLTGSTLAACEKAGIISPHLGGSVADRSVYYAITYLGLKTDPASIQAMAIEINTLAEQFYDAIVKEPEKGEQLCVDALHELQALPDPVEPAESNLYPSNRRGRRIIITR